MSEVDRHHHYLYLEHIISIDQNIFMKPIIVATDFSPASQNAANYAADIAMFLRTDLILVHVIEIPATPFQVPMTEFEYNEIESIERSNMDDLQKKLIARTKNKINIHSEIQYGTVEFEIEKLSYRKKPFAIIMGFKNNNAKRFFMGSNMLKLIHHSLYPVLIVPEDVSFKKIKSIAIASDLDSEEKDISLLFTKEWLNAFGVSPDIIHVRKEENGQSEIGGGIKTLQDNLAEFSPKFYFRYEKGVDEGINSFIAENKPDLLIVIPENHGFLESLFRKSNSKQIILHSQVPVLSVFATNAKQNSNHIEMGDRPDSTNKFKGNGEDKKKMRHTDETHLSA